MRTTSYTERRCAACRVSMPGAPDWQSLCRGCFIESKKREREELIEEVQELRSEVVRLRSIRHALPEPVVIRWLLQRAHPDRHEGSATAHAATQWLLGLRNSLTVGTSA